MAERLGPDLAHWLEAPFELALWCWFHLAERDRTRRWTERASRLEAAELGSLAHHAPQRLRDERTALLAAAGPGDRYQRREQERSRGEALARRLRRALSR